MKTSVRVATEADWEIITRLGEFNRTQFDFDPNIPHSGTWIIGSVYGVDRSAVGWYDGEELQIILLWSPGVESAWAAMRLMAFTIKQHSKPIWFATYKNVSAGAKRTFDKWGFEKVKSDEFWDTYRRPYAQA